MYLEVVDSGGVAEGVASLACALSRAEVLVLAASSSADAGGEEEGGAKPATIWG